MEFAPTLPAQAVLGLVGERMKELISERKGKGRRLHVTLGAAWCPAIQVPAVQGLKNWSEYQELVRATAAEAFDADTEGIASEVDPAHRQIACAMPQALLDQVHGLATQQGLRLRSVQPLWSVATRCKAALKPGVQGVVVHETDAVTVLVTGAHPLACTYRACEGMEAQQQVLRRLTASASLRQENLLSLAFAARVSGGMSLGPSQWAKHWSTA